MINILPLENQTFDFATKNIYLKEFIQYHFRCYISKSLNIKI